MKRQYKELDWEQLQIFIMAHKDQIYCVYAGVGQDWDNTSDEVYHAEFGWLDNNGAYASSSWGDPVAYIHYHNGDIDTFDKYIIVEEEV